MIVELRGLELHGHHGVYEDERTDGQLFLYDVELEVGEERGANDRLEDAVDYTEVAAAVRDCRLRGGSICSRPWRRDRRPAVRAVPPERVRVRVRKPGARPAGLTVEHSAVTVERP